MIGIHSLLSRSCTKAVGEDDEVGEILRLHTEETAKHFDESAEEIRVTAYLENDAQEEGAEQGSRPNRRHACERDHDEANVVNRWAVGCMWLRCRKWRRMMCFRRRLGRHLSKVALNSYKITINHIILVASKRSRSNRILIEVCYEQISETFKLDHQAGFLAKAKERSNMKTIGASQ